MLWPALVRVGDPMVEVAKQVWLRAEDPVFLVAVKPVCPVRPAWVVSRTEFDDMRPPFAQKLHAETQLQQHARLALHLLEVLLHEQHHVLCRISSEPVQRPRDAMVLVVAQYAHVCVLFEVGRNAVVHFLRALVEKDQNLPHSSQQAVPVPSLERVLQRLHAAEAQDAQRHIPHARARVLVHCAALRVGQTKAGEVLQGVRLHRYNFRLRLAALGTALAVRTLVRSPTDFTVASLAGRGAVVRVHQALARVL
mmetsp:Transcript_43482/g.109754  ORF Transcript_43482/g.109754 Transcript_43482/m.109754 type:complete len:252 (-) Transcript_43482:387-1142(-)